MNKITISDSTGKVLYSIESFSAVSTVASDLADLEEAGKKCAESYKEVVALDTAFGICSTEGFGDAAAAMAKKMGEKIKTVLIKIAEFFKKIARFINEKLIKAVASVLGRKSRAAAIGIDTGNISNEATEKYGLAAAIFGNESLYNRFISDFSIMYASTNRNVVMVDLSKLSDLDFYNKSMAAANKLGSEDVLGVYRTSAKDIVGNKNRLSTMSKNRDSVRSKLEKITGIMKTVNEPSRIVYNNIYKLADLVKAEQQKQDPKSAYMDNINKQIKILQALQSSDLAFVNIITKLVKEIAALENSDYKVLVQG